MIHSCSSPGSFFLQHLGRILWRCKLVMSPVKMYVYPNPMLLLLDNSDSPSIVEQLSQGPSFIYSTFISDSFLALWLILCLMPCSWLPAAWVVLCSCFVLDLIFSLRLLSASRIQIASCRDSPSIYLGYSSIELWDSLSVYVHPGIACLAFWASVWLGAFWASLSGFHSSMTLVKLIMIGHCLWPLGWRT